MHHVSRLKPAALFILFAFLFAFLGVSCVGGSDEPSASHDAGNDRSSRPARARASGTESTSHGSSRTSGDHEAAAGGHESASAGHESASAGHGKTDTGHETASAGHGTADTGHETASAGHGAQSQGEAPHWAYAGDLAPSHWGDLADQFAVCVSGASQSPINISNTIDPNPANIDFNYHGVPLSILNNGHTLQVNYAPGSSITIDLQQYELLQFHFHTPSEHQLAAHNFPMEGHLVHKNSHDQLAVVGVFIEEGHENPFFQTLVEHLPSHADQENTVAGIMVNAQGLLPPDPAVYNYSGSLTNPPCSEGVNWNVMSTPIQASADQIAAFAGIMGPNNRPVQPMHSRLVSGQPNEGGRMAVDSGHGTASPSQEHVAPHWEYEGGPGQRLWGELSADFTACVDGSAQSPINVANAIPTPLRNLDFNYHPAQLTIVNNGHTIQGSYGQRHQGDGGSITVDGTEYRLLQFHFHWPSEHMVNGRQFLMELHLVHQNEHGGLGVVGVLLERGEYNRGLEPFWANLPVTPGSTKDPKMFFDINTVLPADQRTFRYPGSLTTPPCSEDVKWLLLRTPVEIASSQAEMFRSIIGYNARYVQPLHGREVLEDSSMD